MNQRLKELLGLENPDSLGEGVAPVTPRSSAKDRFFARVAQTCRFSELIDIFAKDADLPREQAEKILTSIDDKNAWEPGPLPWISLLHFEGGPSRQRHITGVVKVEPGQFFPHHDHLGHEINLVLQGEAHDSLSGKTYRRGDRVEFIPGQAHEIRSTSDIPLLYVAILAEGLTIGDDIIRYDDPRG